MQYFRRPESRGQLGGTVRGLPTKHLLLAPMEEAAAIVSWAPAAIALDRFIVAVA